MQCLNFNFNLTCDIVSCLKLCEKEVHQSLFPRKDEDTLRWEIRRLQTKRESREKRVQQELEGALPQQMICKEDVCGWMQLTKDLIEEVNQFLKSHSSRRWCSCCSLPSNYKRGKKVEELLRRVRDLLDEGKESGNNSLVREVQVTRATETIKPEEEDSWEIFCESLRSGIADLKNQEIQRFAKMLVAECDDLPLTLNAVGQAVKNYTEINQWQAAIERMKNPSAPGIPRIQSILRFCYDSLEDDQMRSCLLCCSLFSKNSNICEIDIIEFWIGEGLLDDNDDLDIVRAYEKGLSVIRKLKDACLLESCNWCDFYFKMHGAVRDMTLQVTDDGIQGGQRNNLVVCTNTSDLQMWSTATRVSLVELKVQDLTDQIPSLAFPNLVSFRRCRSLLRIHQDFFLFMPLLRVLDLSNTKLNEIPSSILSLAELRYLKLSETKIQRLPIELGNLTKLRQLDLNKTYELKKIPQEAISRLSALQALHLDDCGHMWESASMMADRFLLLKLKDLGGLKKLQRLSLKVESKTSLQVLLHSCPTATTRLKLKGGDFTDVDLLSTFTSFQKLQWVEISSCMMLGQLVFGKTQLNNLQEIKLFGLKISRIIAEDPLPNLRHIGIGYCHFLKDLKWVEQLPKLELLCLQDCNEIKKLVTRPSQGSSGIGEDMSNDRQCSFPNLQFLVLHTLPKLESISWKDPLYLPSLITLRVHKCKKLKKLPFGRQSGKNIKEIKGEHRWWELLNWDHDDIRSNFHPHFRPST